MTSLSASQVSALVVSTISEVTEMFKARGWVAPDWKCVTKLSFSEARARSWGGRRHGKPFISMSLARFVNVPSASLNEYKSFCHDREIGSVVASPAKAVKALVIHEMCHAVQFSGTAAMKAAHGGTYEDSRGHGMLWKNLYRVVRCALVNHMTEADVVASIPAAIVARAAVAVTPAAPAMNTMSRGVALSWIFARKQAGWSNKQIIEKLVADFGFKSSTARTYTYTA